MGTHGPVFDYNRFQVGSGLLDANVARWLGVEREAHGDEFNFYLELLSGDETFRRTCSGARYRHASPGWDRRYADAPSAASWRATHRTNRRSRVIATSARSTDLEAGQLS